MKGYFGIGVEGISKAMNLGNLFRSALGFDASFIFTINADFNPKRALSDTADTPGQLPLYQFANAEALVLPRGCELVGVELLDEAAELPSFRHPRRAAYVLGPERGSLSPAMVARCDHVVSIPTKICINLATAGAVVMYDRLLNLVRFPRRPMAPGDGPEPWPVQGAGAPKTRKAPKQKAGS